MTGEYGLAGRRLEGRSLSEDRRSVRAVKMRLRRLEDNGRGRHRHVENWRLRGGQLRGPDAPIGPLY